MHINNGGNNISNIIICMKFYNGETYISMFVKYVSFTQKSLYYGKFAHKQSQGQYRQIL
jgi:hypothetical protein